jgi:hypothetical protein
MEQLKLIEQVRQHAPDLARDVAMLIDELNRLRAEVSGYDMREYYIGEPLRGEYDGKPTQLVRKEIHE